MSVEPSYHLFARQPQKSAMIHLAGSVGKPPIRPSSPGRTTCGPQMCASQREQEVAFWYTKDRSQRCRRKSTSRALISQAPLGAEFPQSEQPDLTFQARGPQKAFQFFLDEQVGIGRPIRHHNQIDHAFLKAREG